MKPIAVDLVGLHIETTTGAPLVLLREHDLPHRVLPIFIGDAEVDDVVDGAFTASLTLSSPTGGYRLDSRHPTRSR